MNTTWAFRAEYSSNPNTRIFLNSTSSTTGEFNDIDHILRDLNQQEVRLMAPVTGYLVLLMITGILGNSVTCYIYRTKMKHTTANRFILCLAVLDLSTCVIGIPFDICDILLEYVFDQPAICKIFRFIIYFTDFTSMAILLSIAVDRFYKICKPLKQSLTRKYKHCVIGCVIFGLCLAIPSLVLYGTVDIATPYIDIEGYGCTIDGNSAFTLVYLGLLFVTVVLIMLSLSILYIYVGLQVRKRSRMTIGEKARPKHSIKENGAFRPKYKVYRATLLCVAITIGFVVSFFPTLILHAIMIGKEGFERTLSNSSYVAFQFFLRSYFLTSVINPVLYGFLNPVFRKECVAIWTRMFHYNKSTAQINAAVWYSEEETET